jgi:hypothetical protein
MKLFWDALRTSYCSFQSAEKEQKMKAINPDLKVQQIVMQFRIYIV